jgi:type II secretory pathway component PulK
MRLPHLARIVHNFRSRRREEADGTGVVGGPHPHVGGYSLLAFRARCEMFGLALSPNAKRPGLRQPSGAFGLVSAFKSRRGLPHSKTSRRLERGSVFIIVLWIALGLVSITLYFANSMALELRASDNRTSGVAADEAIEGAARYVSQVLMTYATNGTVPDPSLYQCQGVPVGNARFWIIGRDNNENSSGIATRSSGIVYGLVDEGSKVNLNTGNSNMISFLPGMTVEFSSAILDWRDTNGNGASQIYYAMRQPPYQCKAGPFETVDELRLVYAADMDVLVGEDVNRNGILDGNESDQNGNSRADRGVLDYTTVYSREPNFHADGTLRTNVTTTAALRSLLRSRFGDARANQILLRLAAAGNGTVNGLLQFYVRSGMTRDEFTQIYDDITVGTENYTRGRVNINTASAAVLACLPGMDESTAQQVVNYRAMHPDQLGTIAWIVDALGSTSAAIRGLQAGNFITTRSYQFTADIAAVGPYGRGYRRVKFVFDLTEDTPKIIYRQDLSRLGWALGDDVRQKLIAQNLQ